jgi:hypothetical protein
MLYNVYLVAYTGVPRDHYVIFIEMNPDKLGYIF